LNTVVYQYQRWMRCAYPPYGNEPRCRVDKHNASTEQSGKPQKHLIYITNPPNNRILPHARRVDKHSASTEQSEKPQNNLLYIANPPNNRILPHARRVDKRSASTEQSGKPQNYLIYIANSPINRVLPHARRVDIPTGHKSDNASTIIQAHTS